MIPLPPRSVILRADAKASEARGAVLMGGTWNQ
jgi:hypothetical protein